MACEYLIYDPNELSQSTHIGKNKTVRCTTLVQGSLVPCGEESYDIKMAKKKTVLRLCKKHAEIYLDSFNRLPDRIDSGIPNLFS